MTAPAVQVKSDRPAVLLRKTLEQVVRDAEGITALAISDPNGLPVDSLIRGSQAIAATAMATMALTAANKIMSSLSLDSPEDVLIEGGSHNVLVLSLGKGFSLLAVFQSSANLGYIKLCLSGRAQELRELLDLLR